MRHGAEQLILEHNLGDLSGGFGTALHRLVARAGACARQLALPGAALLLSLSGAPTFAANPAVDYFVLTLSWSPTYCVEEGQGDRAQCAPGRRFGFVVHGLWPQHARGWPEFCDTRERWVPDDRIRNLLPIMPSKRLIIHEWRKHGTCSGLSQDDYFALTRRLFDKVRIPARYLSPTALISVGPDQLADDFVKSNAWLDRGMMAVDCSNRRDRARLQEIKICFSVDGEPTQCGANERQQCRADTIQMPPVR